MMLMSIFALAATPAAGSPPSTALRRLEALPNVTIRYYDVAGMNLTSINASIVLSRRDPATNAVSVSSSDWSVTIRFNQKIDDGNCEITGAEASFTGSLSLPRLTTRESLPSDQRKVWDQYVSDLASSEAAALSFVYDRLGDIEKAVMTSSCNDAARAAAAAADRIRRYQAEFVRRNKKPAPTIRVPVRDPNDPRG